jgi:predicted transcriptional regulator
MYYMAKALLTVRMDQDRIESLDKVAEGLDRDRTYVVTQAIDAFLDVHKWQIAYIEEAMREAQAGEFASDAEVGRTFARLRGPSGKRKAG